MSHRTRSVLTALVLAASAGPALSEPAAATDPVHALLEEQRRLIEEQREIIERQRRQQQDQQRVIEDLRTEVNDALGRVEHVTGAASGERARTGLGWFGEVGVPPGFEVTVGAHLNRQVTIAADGDNTKAYFVDSSNLPSYAFLKSSVPLGDDLSLRAHVEFALQDNAASSVSQLNETSGFNISGRYFEAIVDSRKYGRLSFGKGLASAFSFIDLAMVADGMIVANLLSLGSTAPGLLFYSDDLDAYSSITVGDAFLDLEGLARINRVRYDAPVWNGLQLSGTVGEDQYADATLRYRDELGDFSLLAVTSYQNDANGPFSEWRVDSAVAIHHRPTGLNLTAGGAFQEAQDDSRRSEGFLVRAGWRRRLYEFGETKLAVDYSHSWDVTAAGDRARSFGAFALQEVDWLGLQLYAGYRNYDLSRDDIGLDGIHVFTTGASLFFDVTAGGD
ncbi:MAG: hypothetical protein QNK03_08205 [Myxococcota bacterium]|nr:hypothetical protein [Myxococcota bacterium]